jgi:MoxR-like ATPase
MVIATQNPIEHEGTYPLPEAQLDRFMVRLVMGYPSREKELEILDTHGRGSSYADLEPVVEGDEVRRMIHLTRLVHVADAVKEYMVDAVEATRGHPDLMLGASPRATLYLQRASRSVAAVAGRNYVTPDDVKACMRPILTHRLILRPEAQMAGVLVEDVVDSIAELLPVPRSGVRI